VRSAEAATLSNDVFSVQIGEFGEIASLKLTGDAFPTEYVLNATNAPGQATADHQWVGELLFSYRLGEGAWRSASTNQSEDVRQVVSTADTVTVTYENSQQANGIKDFKVVETYALASDGLSWSITVTNTSGQSLQLGDFGLPLPFNEFWFGGDFIYETRTLYHSFVGQNSSFIHVGRPSGIGDSLLLVPEPSTGAGFEYMDSWIDQEHPGSAWAANGGNPAWPNGLDVFYIHSDVIKSTQRGYLPNTSLTLAAGQSKTYTFRFLRVKSDEDRKDKLAEAGLIDVTALPGMMFATDMTAKFDLHTDKPIVSVVPQYPEETTVTPLTSPAGHHLYELHLSHLGPNLLTVTYGAGELTTLQFYALEPLETALQRHATFMVDKTQWTDPNVDQYGIFDDWMMATKSKRGNFSGGWGWGDDWGWTHGQFLAEKNAQTPVATEVAALDLYLNAIWARAIDHDTYVVQDWWCPAGTSPTHLNDCYYDRAFAYPHAFNTYFSMYKVARLYPDLITYQLSADAYLMRAYGILHALYNGHGDPATGYMGEQTLPEIYQALLDEGHATEAADVSNIIQQVHDAFSGNTYPYGSEYSFDNTGEEAVYMAAKFTGDASVLEKVDRKTRACRGKAPVWYYYADPVSVNGENWWQFQYSAALLGWAMDDWTRNHSATPELDERMTYAAKIANVSAINSGQIDEDPENLGTVAWTYQAAKGTTNICTADCFDTLHNGWRGMSGEADLGLFGAIRILSADVAQDPLFGLFGYGCDVAASDTCYAITPRDGVRKKLQLVSEHLQLELDRDRYSQATVSRDKTSVALTLLNDTPNSAHTTKLKLLGFAPGNYELSVDGTSEQSVTVPATGATTVELPVAAKASVSVSLGSPCEVPPNGGTGGGAGSAGQGAAGGAGTAAGGGAATSGAGGTGSGASGSTPGSHGDGGCGCSVPSQPRSSAWLIAGLLATLALVRRNGRRGEK